jgi:hypothetical protein
MADGFPGKLVVSPRGPCYRPMDALPLFSGGNAHEIHFQPANDRNLPHVSGRFMLRPSVWSRSSTASPRPMRIHLITLLSAALLTGCAETKPVQEPEGSVAFRSGTGDTSDNQTFAVEGPAFLHPGILVPAHEPIWQAAWINKDEPSPLMGGATSGLITGMGIMQMLPIGLTFWPAAVGIVAGAAAMGILGAAQEDPALQRMSPPDQKAIADATMNLRPDRLFREAMTVAIAHRLRSPPPVVTWQQGWGADTAGTDPLLEARATGLDGVLNFAVDAIGLAVGEERDTFGVFIQVRVRALDARDGQLRYERVLSYGPGRPVEGLPKSDFHTTEFLAMDKAHLYRHLASEAIGRMARLLAEDPALPLAPR